MLREAKSEDAKVMSNRLTTRSETKHETAEEKRGKRMKTTENKLMCNVMNQLWFSFCAHVWVK